MKKTLLIISAILFAATIQAQFHFGPQIGYTASKLTTNTSDITSSVKNNFLFGAFVRIGEKFYVQPEVNWLTQGGIWEADGIDMENTKLEMTYKTEKDSILFSTYDFSQSFRMRLENSKHEGGTINDAFTLLHKGDSAVFKIDAKNFFLYSKNTKVPSYIEKGDKLIFNVKLKKFFSQDDILKEKQAARHENFESEMALLKRYLKLTNITTKPTESGIYFIEERKGNGYHPTEKSFIGVHYIGSFINGKPFENSYELNKPLEFRLGEHAVIPGFEEAIKLMTVGSRAKVIIPSNMAYGKDVKSAIPPYSTLVFQLELLGFK